MADLLLMETGNGGDIVLRGNDLALVDGIENVPYISMFGGGNSPWWGNDLLLSNKPALQFTSETETILKTVVLNSNGRIKIENAIKNDLSRLCASTGSKATVTATIISPDRLELKVNFDGQTFFYLWNPAEEFLTYKI